MGAARKLRVVSPPAKLTLKNVEEYMRRARELKAMREKIIAQTTAEITAELNSLEGQLRELCLKKQETIKTAGGMIVYTAPRKNLKWQTDKLLGYAAAGHPEIRMMCEEIEVEPRAAISYAKGKIEAGSVVYDETSQSWVPAPEHTIVQLSPGKARLAFKRR